MPLPGDNNRIRSATLSITHPTGTARNSQTPNLQLSIESNGPKNDAADRAARLTRAPASRTPNTEDTLHFLLSSPGSLACVNNDGLLAVHVLFLFGTSH